MSVRTANAAFITLILGTLFASLILYPYLPALLPIHWNGRGEPDGWADKSGAAFLMPAFIAVGLVLMHVLPRFASGRYDIRPFEDTYRYIWVVVAALFTHIHSVMLLSGLHPDHEYGRALFAGLCVALALMGNVLGKVRRNPWVGIRVPWTLASDDVWIPTHRLAARLLFAAGLFSAAAIVLGAPLSIMLWLMGIALFLPVVYSYFLYAKLERP